MNSRYETSLTCPFGAAILAAGTPDLPPHVKLGEIPFDFERRRISVLVRLGEHELLISKGAPESLLADCTHYEISGSIREFDQATRHRAELIVNDLGHAGFRVLAVAWRAVPPETNPNDLQSESSLTLAGLLAFSDPPLPDAGQLLRALASQGVRVKLLTGDNERVTAYVWRSLGMEPTQIVLGSELEGLDALALERIVENVEIFARVTPRTEASDRAGPEAAWPFARLPRRRYERRPLARRGGRRNLSVKRSRLSARSCRRRTLESTPWHDSDEYHRGEASLCQRPQVYLNGNKLELW